MEELLNKFQLSPGYCTVSELVEVQDFYEKLISLLRKHYNSVYGKNFVDIYTTALSEYNEIKANLERINFYIGYQFRLQAEKEMQLTKENT